MTETEASRNAADVVQSTVLDGRVSLLQPARGYRAGMDAALLAAAAASDDGRRLFEAGCGAGAVMLQLAARRPDLSIVGLERDPAAAVLARANVEANGATGRVEVIEGDVAAGFAVLGQGPFDHAISNPPFFDDESTLRGPAPARRGAWIADDGLAAWIDLLTLSVRSRGRITLIHRGDRLGDILSLLAPRAGSVAIRPIQPHADEPAKRVLVRAVRDGRAPLRLLPPLVLHDRSGAKHTPETEAILRGRADLGFD